MPRKNTPKIEEGETPGEVPARRKHGRSPEVDVEEGSKEKAAKKAKSDEKEERKRKETQDMYRRQEEEFSQYIQARYEMEQWKPLLDENGNRIKPPADLPEGQLQVDNMNTMVGLLKDGVYTHPDHPGMPIILSEGSIKSGVKYLSDTAIFGKSDYEKFVEAALDFAAVGKGSRSVTIDDKNITEKRLMMFMKAAKERGMEVEFGPNIKKFLESSHDDKESPWRLWGWEKELDPVAMESRKMRCKAAQKELHANALRHEQTDLWKDNKEAYKLNTYSKNFEKQPKLNGDDADERKGNLKTAKYESLGDNPSTSDKLKVIKGELKDFEQRAKVLRTTKGELNTSVKASIEDLKGGEDDVERAKKKIDFTEPATRAFTASARKEFDDLRERKELWVAELRQMRDAIPAEDQRTEQDTKDLAKINEMIKAFNKASRGTDPQRLEDKIASLPEKVNEATERLEAVAQAAQQAANRPGARNPD